MEGKRRGPRHPFLKINPRTFIKSRSMYNKLILVTEMAIRKKKCVNFPKNGKADCPDGALLKTVKHSRDNYLYTHASELKYEYKRFALGKTHNEKRR